MDDLILYTVSYKSISGLFWHKIRNVVADSIQDGFPFRVLIQQDETRIELPLGIPVMFSKERSAIIKANNAKSQENAEAKKQEPKLVIPGGRR